MTNKMSEILSMARVLKKASRLKPQSQLTENSLGLSIEINARKFPNDPMVVFEGKTITWDGFNTLSNKISNHLKYSGVKKGDVVSIFMENRVETMAAITGVVKIGAVASMVNTNLSDNPLIHCVSCVNSGYLLFGEELLQSVEDVHEELRENGVREMTFFSDSRGVACPKWALVFNESDFKGDNPPETKDVLLGDLAYYIFTSGTTGLPKASRMTHDKHRRMSESFSTVLLDMKKNDRIYMCLPLYHSSAMFIGFGSITHSGASMFLRRKFSASKFLDEAREHNTTCFAYIGELCRYLLLQPKREDDADNPIVKCVGNGLRPDIWMDFKTRYGIDKIGEFYGASEGNGGCVNAFNKDKTIGFCPVKHVLVKYDVREERIVTGYGGWCRKAKKNDPGLMLIEINKKAVYDGYADSEASENKVVHNVLKRGDSYFNTGDLLRRVDVGFSFFLPHYEFVDRVGDTYRWKGENVSTNEVGEIINAVSSVEYCNIYGVQIPGTDGRAGMAAIIPISEAWDLEGISQHINENIPSYARPIFLRKLKAMDTTATFKMKKGELKEQAFHPTRCKDPVFVLKPGSDRYQLLDETFYMKLIAGSAGY